MAKHQFKRKNLIWLVWPPNICYSHLQVKTPKGVAVDLKCGTWTLRGSTHIIGITDHNSCEDPRNPIGAYDRVKFSHLEEFKRAVEWVKERNRCRAFDD